MGRFCMSRWVDAARHVARSRSGLWRLVAMIRRGTDSRTGQGTAGCGSSCWANEVRVGQASRSGLEGLGSVRQTGQVWLWSACREG